MGFQRRVDHQPFNYAAAVHLRNRVERRFVDLARVTGGGHVRVHRQDAFGINLSFEGISFHRWEGASGLLGRVGVRVNARRAGFAFAHHFLNVNRVSRFQRVRRDHVNPYGAFVDVFPGFVRRAREEIRLVTMFVRDVLVATVNPFPSVVRTVLNRTVVALTASVPTRDQVGTIRDDFCANLYFRVVVQRPTSRLFVRREFAQRTNHYRWERRAVFCCVFRAVICLSY